MAENENESPTPNRKDENRRLKQIEEKRHLVFNKIFFFALTEFALKVQI